MIIENMPHNHLLLTLTSILDILISLVTRADITTVSVCAISVTTNGFKDHTFINI